MAREHKYYYYYYYYYKYKTLNDLKQSNGNTAYITQLKQHSTFLSFAVLVVWCRPCHRYRLF